MKKMLLAIALIATLTGCGEKEKEVIIEEVKIQGSISIYLSEVNYTVVNYSFTNFDINSDGKIVVTYEVEKSGYPNILKIEDNTK